jgi:hypothetical protein
VPLLTLTFDADTFTPGDDFPWDAQPPAGGGPVINPAPWIPWIEWMDPVGAFQLTDDPGIYIIEMGGIPVYAGKAANIQTRFVARANALHEMGANAATIAGQTVRFAAVAVVPGGFFAPISLAEHWLIRYLFVRDFALPARHLVNVARRDSFPAPAGGLSIRFDPVVAPAYLSDGFATAQAGWTNPAPNVAGFDYLAGVAILP